MDPIAIGLLLLAACYVHGKIVMSQLQKTMDFTDVDEGVPWKQGFHIEYHNLTFEGEPIVVHIVPWTHVDPGWRKTYEEYFPDVKNILDAVVDVLSNKIPEARFIWGEISYLEMWWRSASSSQKKQLRTLVRENKFEIVTGGWVQADEATTHYQDIISEMNDGLSWVWETLQVHPRFGYSNDPFGHSSFLPHLLSLAEFEGTVINRIHFAYKKEFAHNKSLEFMWEQDFGSYQPLFTHVMPFFAYDIPHTCGPNPKVCALYDFSALRRRTEWGDLREDISPENLQTKANDLLQQYKEKAMLFKTNHLLVPLGYDFSYATPQSLERQLTSYQVLIQEINKQSQVMVKFSTISDYITSVTQSRFWTREPSPMLEGDFFPYSDLRQDYWTGFFSSRAFYKALIRQLSDAVRASQLLLSVCVIREPMDLSNVTILLQEIQSCSHIVSLYQHHDAITGTSKLPVVIDYGKKIFSAREKATRLLEYLLEKTIVKKETPCNTPHLSPNYVQTRYDTVDQPLMIHFEGLGCRPVVLFNSLIQEHSELVSLIVSTPFC
ncbi:alpha-mannosidase 2x [Pelomyxa schiedti]|nr:alpha-mannosidase 2x [Pelomyxa schiedti]